MRKLSSKIIEKMLNLETYLNHRIRGQEHALSRIAKVIRRCEFGYITPFEPLSSFLLFGPTGVGKTETCRVLAEYLYGDVDKLIRFDMSEFMELDTGRLFLERMDYYTRDLEDQGGIILFDEMEKAHPDILMYFLQILSAGRLTYHDHRTGDLSKFYLVFTSNLGTELLVDIQSEKFPFSALERAVITRAKNELRPEFFHRIKNHLVYRRLDYDIQREIASMYLGQETENWGVKNFKKECLELVIRKGIDVRGGARPLKGMIEDEVRDALTDAALEGKLPKHPQLIEQDYKLKVLKETGKNPDCGIKELK